MSKINIKDINNKFNLSIIASEEYSEDSEYDVQSVKRTFTELNLVFGIVDKKINEMESKERALYLQNLIFNLHLRFGMTIVNKEQFMDSMCSMYDRGQEVKEKSDNK